MVVSFHMYQNLYYLFFENSMGWVLVLAYCVRLSKKFTQERRLILILTKVFVFFAGKMSFLNLFNSIPNNGRIRIEGGQTQGAVVSSTERLSVNRYKPSLGKGSEYAARIKAEEDTAYLEVNHDSVHKHANSGIRIIRVNWNWDQPPQIQKLFSNKFIS